MLPNRLGALQDMGTCGHGLAGAPLSFCHTEKVAEP